MSPASTPGPEITALNSQIYLDPDTKQKWAAGNMAAIEAKKAVAKNDLQPIYTNITNNAEKAFAKVQASNGEIYYLSWSSSAVVWSYVKSTPNAHAPKSGSASVTDTPDEAAHISVGSYSTNAKFLGISGYIWSNLGVSRMLTFLILPFF